MKGMALKLRESLLQAASRATTRRTEEAVGFGCALGGSAWGCAVMLAFRTLTRHR